MTDHAKSSTLDASENDAASGTMLAALVQGNLHAAHAFGFDVEALRKAAGLTDAIPTQLSGKQRAVAIPVSGARGLVGFVASGDRVDVYYGTGSTGGAILGLLAPNILVMRAPAVEGQPAILRADALLAQKLALAADTGTLWFLLRPAGDAKNAPKKSVTSAELLAQMVWAAVHGVVSLRIAKCDDPWIEWRPADEVSDRLCDAILEGILAPVPVAGKSAPRRVTAKKRG